MTLPTTRQDREFRKFTETSDGKTAVRVEASMIQGDATSIQGVTVNNTPPTDKQRLVYNSSTEQWEPTSASSLGWISINDTTYTNESPFEVSANTRTKFLINKDTEIVEYSPTGDSSWWNESTDRFEPDAIGAYWEIRLSMRINPNKANRNLKIELEIPTVGVIYTDDFRMTSGAGDFYKSFVIPIFSRSGFVANGGEFYLTSTTGLDISETNLVIFKQWTP